MWCSEKMRSAALLKDKKKRNVWLFMMNFLPGTPKDIFTWVAALADDGSVSSILVILLSRIPSVLASTWSGHELMQENYLVSGIIFGALLLIGIVKKNAIMMIDFALVAEREEGLTPENAIYQACLLRFRPIMMTTTAALFGALPLALGHGDGAEMRIPLGISIVGGLILSQLLTLYTTPIVYLYLDRFRKRLAEKKAAAKEETV